MAFLAALADGRQEKKSLGHAAFDRRIQSAAHVGLD